MKINNKELRKEVYKNFLLIHRMVQRQRLVKCQTDKNFKDSTRGQGKILRILKIKPEMQQKELLFLLDISKQSLAELLAKLEKNGYIVREPSLEDRRVLVVKLTQKGKDVDIGTSEDSLKHTSVLSEFKEEELEQFNFYLKKILDKYEDIYKDIYKDDEYYYERNKAFESFVEYHNNKK